MDEWINKLWSIQMMDIFGYSIPAMDSLFIQWKINHLFKKRNEILIRAIASCLVKEAKIQKPPIV